MKKRTRMKTTKGRWSGSEKERANERESENAGDVDIDVWMVDLSKRIGS